MIKPEQVPKEVIEAAAVQIFKGSTMSQAIAAAINAWPGVHFVCDIGIHLPLPQDDSND